MENVGLVFLGIGVFVGLGGILVCSFLGGMKAVTWTQVAQYIILIVAYMIPVVWLSVMHTGNPIPQISAYTTALPKVTALEKEFNNKDTPKGAAEESVRAIFRERAAAADAKLKGLAEGGPAFLASEKQKLVDKLDAAKATGDAKAAEAAEKAVKDFPADVAAAKAAWTKDKAGAAARAAPVKAHAEPFPATGKTPEEQEKARGIAKKNFLALIFCLMVGTAALPHILMRFYTVPDAKAARTSVLYATGLIGYFYIDCPTCVHTRQWNTWKGPLFDPQKLESAAGRTERFKAGSTQTHLHRKAGNRGVVCVQHQVIIQGQPGIGAFPHRRRDFLHPGAAGVLLQDPGSGEQAVGHAHRAAYQRKSHNIHTVRYPPIK